LVWSFFFGLIIASILLIWKQITNWKPISFAALIIGIILTYYITIARPVSSPDSYPYIFLSGFIAIIAMILPGISGAFILLLIGIDKKVCSSINLKIEDNTIQDMTFFKNTDSYLYPESEFPENARKLRGFVWRGDEEIKSKDDIFPQEELDLDEKIQTETKAKELLENVPMEILKETLDYDKNNSKKEKK